MSRWTDAVDQQASVFFRTLTEADIRKRQDLAMQQLRLALDQGNFSAADDLEVMHNALSRELRRRLDKRNA